MKETTYIDLIKLRKTITLQNELLSEWLVSNNHKIIWITECLKNGKF